MSSTTESTGYDHRARLARSRGVSFEESTLPEELAYLVTWYEEIRARNLRGFRFEPIQFSEIEAYGRVFPDTVGPMTEFEVEMLCRLDTLWQVAQPDPKTK